MNKVFRILIVLLMFAAMSGFQTRTDPSPRAVLRPRVTGPISLRMNQPARQLYETLADLAGIQVIFHRQFQSGAPVMLVLENVDIFGALDLLSFQTGNFWQAEDDHTIIVATDNPTVRREVEPMIMKTFYLVNVTRQQDITELVTMLRSTLQINQISVSTPLSALVVRDTPDRIALVELLLMNSGVISPAPKPAPAAPVPTGNGGPALAARIARATAIAVDGAGNIFVLDTGHVRRVTTDGIIRAISTDDIADLYAADIAADAEGNLYIADDINHRVRKLSPSGTIQTIAGNGRAGFRGDGGRAVDAQLSAPRKVAVDGAGNIYVADSGNQRIRRITPKGGIDTIAGNGAWGFAGDGGPAQRARLSAISGIAVDGAGNIYIGDGGARTRRITPKGMIETIAGTGAPGSRGDGGPAVRAEIEVASLAADRMGNVFIVEVNRIRQVTPDGLIRTIAGANAPGFAGDGGPAVAARFSGPRAIAVNADGTLYIADTLNGRIRRVTPDGVISTVAGTAPDRL
ncbi:MAG TPA: hypothetical protein VFY29_15100 [Terriglobia bacterium]|nr:hypothetical protein [Terriglobia bacterium]